MSVSADTLRTLHRIHSQLADLRGQLERGPKAIQLRKTAVANLEQAAADSHETVKQHRLNADRKQLDLKASEERIVTWQNNLNTCASNKEYQTLQEQIAAAEMANSVLADEVLELLDRIDELETAAAKADDELASARNELADFAAGIEEKAAGLRSEIERLEGDLADTEKDLPGDLKAQYQLVIRNKGAEGLAAAEDRVCTGCGQQITLNQQNSLKMSQPVFCGACGSLLYLPE